MERSESAAVSEATEDDVIEDDVGSVRLRKMQAELAAEDEVDAVLFAGRAGAAAEWGGDSEATVRAILCSV